jgi:pyridoxal phosphate enzyme (YggS family)
MAVDKEAYQRIRTELGENVTLVAVSKTKPVEDIKALYDLGQRDFGENYVQELIEKAEQLPKDIRWHFIGHLQTNKVKYIAPIIYLIHVADSFRLLQEINKQALKNDRVIDCLMQVYIAQEETKFGLDEKELQEVINEVENSQMKNVRVAGLMGMASFTEDMNAVRKEFHHLKIIFDKYAKLATHNSRLRIGSLIFGERVN